MTDALETRDAEIARLAEIFVNAYGAQRAVRELRDRRDGPAGDRATAVIDYIVEQEVSR